MADELIHGLTRSGVYGSKKIDAVIDISAAAAETFVRELPAEVQSVALAALRHRLENVSHELGLNKE